MAGKLKLIKLINWYNREKYNYGGIIHFISGYDTAKFCDTDHTKPIYPSELLMLRLNCGIQLQSLGGTLIMVVYLTKYGGMINFIHGYDTAKFCCTEKWHILLVQNQ